jgi:hypothetical protein
MYSVLSKIAYCVYNICMSNTNVQAMNDEIIANQIIKLFQYRIEHPKLSMKQACEELGMPYQRTLDWINQGKIGEYLAQIHDVRSDISQIMALNELPEIVEYQAKIATGKVQPRGANPTAAAQFVLEVARIGSKDDGTKSLTQVNVWLPEMVKEINDASIVDASSKVVDG